MDQFKPEGYNSVSPYLIVNGAQKLIYLLNAIFNVKQLRRYDRPDGKIMHAEVQLDDSVLMIADATEQYEPNVHLMHVYVENVDETYKKAIAAGCTSAGEPEIKEGDPDKRGSFIDFAGNMWAVGT